MDQISTVDCTTLLLRQLWEELVPWERTPWHWSKHLKFRPSWLFHKGCAFLCTAVKLQSCQWTQHTGPSPPSKCTAQLPSLNLVNRMCLSNSDVEVQSAGYTSAQSPTNWESIHDKDLSILRRPSSRLSIALDDKNTKCDIQDCGLTEQICTNFLMTNFLIFDRNFVINTITISLGPRPMQNGLKYGMFQTDFDVCANFRCVRWCHHKTVLYLAHIHCRNV